MKIQLTLIVKGLKNKTEAGDFANSLAEHILETFNDDNSISSEVWFKVLGKK